MKLKIIGLLVLISFSMTGFSQFKATSGDLSALKGQEKVLVEFQYAEELLVNRKPEQEYIDKLNNRGGEEAETMWRVSKYLYVDFFIGEMNDKLSKSNFVAVKDAEEGAEYKLIVLTTDMATGTRVGDLPANITGRILLVKIGEEDEILADFDMKQLRSDLEKTSVKVGLGGVKIDVTKLKKTDYFDRLSKAYGIGGKRFANKVKKVLK